MQSLFDIEIEVAYRRLEFERTLATAAQVVQARPKNGWQRWSPPPHRPLAHLRSLFATWLPIASSGNTSTRGIRATSLERGNAIVR